MATAACSRPAGNLVIEGTTRQTFAIFRATDGKQLWEMPTQSAPVAGPITFMAGGEQYIAVNAGWGGGAAQVERGAGIQQNRASARLLVFKLGGKLELPALSPAPPIPDPPPLRATEDVVRKGARALRANLRPVPGSAGDRRCEGFAANDAGNACGVQRHRAQGIPGR